VNGSLGITDLSGTGNRLVLADNLGNLHVQGVGAAADQVLQTDGAGAVSWETIGDHDWYDKDNPGDAPDAITDNIYTQGNVGIGDTDPTATLNVVGPIRASTDATEVAYIEMDKGGTNAFINYTGGGDIDFRYDQANMLSLGYTPGSESAPDGRIEVYADGTVSSAIIRGDGTTVFNEGARDIDFRIEGNGEANLLFVDASADGVGIGTSTPDAALHVYNDILQVGNFNSVIGNRLTIASTGNIKHTYGLNDGSTETRHGRFEIINNASSIVQSGNDAGAYITRSNNGRWGAIAGSTTGALNFFTGGTSPSNQGYTNHSAD
ncbi:MAG: hypothetical protein GY746_08900, partial [Gammaproteobacteria bacterium]|nr:hypothetical protein [Gammaproteobacteria bacterium]